MGDRISIRNRYRRDPLCFSTAVLPPLVLFQQSYARALANNIENDLLFGRSYFYVEMNLVGTELGRPIAIITSRDDGLASLRDFSGFLCSGGTLGVEG